MSVSEESYWLLLTAAMEFSLPPWSPSPLLRSFLLTASMSVTLCPPSFPGGWIYCVFASCGGHGVKHTCWGGDWLKNHLPFLTAPNELNRSRGQEAISPLLPRLWTQLVPFLPFFLSIPPSQSLLPFHSPDPTSQAKALLAVHYHKSTNNVTSLPSLLSE